SNKYLVGVAGNTYDQDDFLSFSFVTATPTNSGTLKLYLGNGTGAGNLVIFKTVGNTVAARDKAVSNVSSGLPSSAVTGMVAVGRNSPSSGFIFANGVTTPSGASSNGNASQATGYFASGAGSSPTDARMFGFYYGPYSDP